MRRILMRTISCLASKPRPGHPDFSVQFDKLVNKEESIVTWNSLLNIDKLVLVLYFIPLVHLRRWLGLLRGF